MILVNNIVLAMGISAAGLLPNSDDFEIIVLFFQNVILPYKNDSMIIYLFRCRIAEAICYYYFLPSRAEDDLKYFFS